MLPRVSMSVWFMFRDCLICPNYIDSYSAVTDIHSAFTDLMN